jgi:hypothetical protein
LETPSVISLNETTQSFSCFTRISSKFMPDERSIDNLLVTTKNDTTRTNNNNEDWITPLSRTRGWGEGMQGREGKVFLNLPQAHARLFRSSSIVLLSGYLI